MSPSFRALCVIGLMMTWSAEASADTCTVTGALKYEPTDLYYCDTDRFSSCSGWNETNVDKKRGTSAASVSFARVTVLNSAGTATLATTHTNASGGYSATFSLTGACATQKVRVRLDFLRVDERDLAASAPRYRFRVVDRTTAASFRFNLLPTVTLSGASTTFNHTKLATESDEAVRYYATYYTMNSAITEVIKWSTRLRDTMTSATVSEQQPVVMDSLWEGVPTTEASPAKRGKIWMPYSGYRSGGTLRHELGHWVHQVLHGRNQARGVCVNESYNSVAGHGQTSCEHGYFAMLEGTATFLGVRSVTSADTNAWMCWASTATSNDGCSIAVAGRTDESDNDGIGTGWAILGDLYADRASRCSTLESKSCGCTGTGCTSQSSRNTYGFRIETQSARFLWDMLDANNESSLDDSNYTMGTVATALQGMPCDQTKLGADGTCNEATVSGTSCMLDKYNVYDIAALLSGDESQERTLNCINGAVD